VLNMRLLFIFGTRPEAIKLAPLIKEFQKFPDKFDIKICVTAQHREMLDQVLNFFQIKPDYDLNIMESDQNLFEVTSKAIKGLEKVVKEARPDLIFVQGDTSTAFVGALAGFYQKIKVAHIEAGLRSYDKYSPFPEEMNRLLAGQITDYHFAPTKVARQNLINEGISENVYVVGNTVIDALFLTLNVIRNNGIIEKGIINYFNNIIPDFSSKLLTHNSQLILITAHRRESFGEPFKDICRALREIAETYKDSVEIIYPVHPNPNVRKTVYGALCGIKNIHLIEPLDYPHLIWLMSKSHIILTDSGGIQEEAPSLGKPVLVMRDVTEREEGIRAGTAKLVGTDKKRIISEVVRLLDSEDEYKKMANSANPYGDGNASERIVEIVGREIVRE